MRGLLLVILWLSTASAAQAGEAPTFPARVAALTPDQRSRMMGVSWNAPCPVPLDDLVSVQLSYIGFDAAAHVGSLVVHRKLAGEVSAIFGELFAARFPVERMQPYEDFPAGEYASHNDTVGFYCRPAQDNLKIFSWHAYGVSIDVNPMTNPYRDPKGWWPAGSDGNRDRAAPGLLNTRSEAVGIFMRHGWMWGGFQDPPDYMHFSKIMLGDQDNPLERPVWAGRLEFAPE